TRVELAQFDAGYTDKSFDKESAKKRIQENCKALDHLGYRLYAENRRSLLLVLQGMDTSGKDGTIRSVTSGFNPLSCQVVSFKQPSAEELDHDFLWRIHAAVPRRGNIGIFNRSHYEDVLVVRVHQLVSPAEWESRFELINSFERLLVEGDMTIIKCFLHISKDEQRERLQERLDDPSKNWKFSKGDLAERARWDDYMAAYEDALTRCNTSHAPWHIIPSNRKWFRDLAVSELLRTTLERMDPHFPRNIEDLSGLHVT
ncbi:MAG TPA: polyphosphate kinase 2 family protein, partial [Pirellulaceae bacterium]